MKLKNILFAVKDMDISKKFYQELFGMQIVKDFGSKVILTDGLCLQDRKIWESFTKKAVCSGSNDAELYFEENELDLFIEKLSHFQVKFVHTLLIREWEQRTVCFYDPDGHMIEVAETMEAVCRRLLSQGCLVEEIAGRTHCPAGFVKNCMEEK